MASGSKDWFPGRSRGEAETSGAETPVEPDDAVPPRASRKAWGQLQGKPQMGLALFSVKGNYRSPTYIHLVDMQGDGGRLTLYFSHMTVEIVGKGLDVLADGLRRQVIPYIQEQHVSAFEAAQTPHWIESLTIGPPAEEGALGSWAG